MRTKAASCRETTPEKTRLSRRVPASAALSGDAAPPFRFFSDAFCRCSVQTSYAPGARWIASGCSVADRRLYSRSQAMVGTYPKAAPVRAGTVRASGTTRDRVTLRSAGIERCWHRSEFPVQPDQKILPPQDRSSILGWYAFGGWEQLGDQKERRPPGRKKHRNQSSMPKHGFKPDQIGRGKSDARDNRGSGMCPRSQQCDGGTSRFNVGPRLHYSSPAVLSGRQVRSGQQQQSSEEGPEH